MIFPKESLALALLMLFATASTSSGACVSPGSLLCGPTTNPPTLDGDLGDWSDVTGIETPITGALGSIPYEPGNLGIKCVYDDTRIYFAVEIPGAYRFDSEDNHKCAAIATMMKMGPDATYVNMGGCPNAMAGCDSIGTVPSECDNYKVDIGGHWELKTTEMGKEYPVNVSDRTGDDAVANKDDEYAVSPYCRFDDDGQNAGNEWAGAWLHTTSPTTGVSRTANNIDTGGAYIFEMSRLLMTDSPETDAQLEAGKSYGFGVAYWDPNQTEQTGWTAAGHFVTGCSKDWIGLVLDDGTITTDSDDGTTTTNNPTSAAGVKVVAVLAMSLLSAVAYILM